MSIDNIISEFKKYIIPLYLDIIFLQNVKNMLIEDIDRQDFLSQFQGEKFALLPTYFLLIHDTIVLKICHISDVAKLEDDYNLKKFLKKFSKNFLYDCNKDNAILEEIHKQYKDLRNKKIAHFTTKNFTEKNYKKENGKIINDIKHNDMFSFNKLDEDISIIENLVLKYANLLDIKIESIQKRQKIKYENFPKITSNLIHEKKLFAPLF